jgi:hypothetical protein
MNRTGEQRHLTEVADFLRAWSSFRLAEDINDIGLGNFELKFTELTGEVL